MRTGIQVWVLVSGSFEKLSSKTYGPRISERTRNGSSTEDNLKCFPDGKKCSPDKGIPGLLGESAILNKDLDPGSKAYREDGDVRLPPRESIALYVRIDVVFRSRQYKSLQV